MHETLASIDIGTNTFRLLISDRDRNGVIHTRLLRREVTRLGGGFAANGSLAGEAMKRGVATLSVFSSLLKEHRVSKMRAVATSVVREARNGKEFLAHVKEETGLDVDVIDGDEEASLALKGILSSVNLKTRYALSFDIGGGSTEYILSDRRSPVYSESLRLGVVHATETFLKSEPTGTEEIETLSSHVSDKLRPLFGNLSQRSLEDLLPPANRDITLIGTAGTITTLAAMDQGLENYAPSMINNYVLTSDAVKRLLGMIAPLPLNKRRELKALECGREDLIVAGAVIVLKTMEIFGFDRMTVSDGGLLEGILIDMIEKQR